ncbi:hypothetical protein AAHA92_03333 [Salvia divinorum]|uniref:Uncharacterized protein n=1 Tax=Salvia divinorum TaxID=28513 RepID=A0ABD1IKV9_SALDI
MYFLVISGIYCHGDNSRLHDGVSVASGNFLAETRILDEYQTANLLNCFGAILWKVTFNMSKAVVREHIVDFTAKALGSSSYRSAIKSGFNDTNIDNENRYAFKYGCIRGVYTFFFVNRLPLADAGSTLNYEGWRKVLDASIRKAYIPNKSMP